MKRYLRLFTFACVLLPVTLQSCHTTRHAAASKASHQPKFIDDVYIAPHNKTNTTTDAIDSRKTAEKKPPTKAQAKLRNSDIALISPTNNDRVNKVPEAGTVKKKYAEILGVKQKEITNYALYQFIDKWYGTDYHLGGKDKTGIDCSGFAQKLYGEVYGMDLLRTSTEQFSNCKRIKHSKDAEEGDLVFFRISGKRISHVGVYLANDFFVHASTTGGVMISNLNEEYWHKYYAGCGRVPKGGQ